MIVGHPKLTKLAYEQPPKVLQEAVRFAEAAVHNGLGKDNPLSHAQETRLKAQIERDYLVMRLSLTSSDRGISK